ncbi:MAG TPA: single-stranded-DNA-specific exonuclease RecJ, partial [Aggregatilineales bacterium]|nr:single-stranded-DNA-specific exonuclease RecJ [Aggregatilineales bacterium]
MTTRNIWAENNLSPGTVKQAHLFSETLAIPELVSILLLARGIDDVDTARAFLDPAAYRPALPEALPDLEKASKRLLKALKHHEKVLVWGDFDVDGVSASALLYEGFTRAGLDVFVHIPQEHGIYLSELQPLCTDYRPALLVTCDNSLLDSLSHDYTKVNHIDVIVVDHHRLPDAPPEVHALVNPDRLPARHPQRTLSAVGVAFLLIQHLYGELGLTRFLDQLLDLVPLGLIADLAELRADTRFLVQRGLEALRRSPRPGLVQLLKIARVEQSQITADDIALQIAPRLNAFARFGNPYDAFRLLTIRKESEINILVAQADALNQKRRLITRQMLAAAREQVELDPSLLGWTALTLDNSNWDSAMIGSVTSQLAAEFMRPVALIVPDEEKGVARGSARSYGAYDVVAALADIKNNLIGFGGHPGAAGFSLDIDALPAFRRRFSDALKAQHPDHTPETLSIDAELNFNQLTLDFAQDIERLAPFGAGNPRPIFVSRHLKRIRSAKIGRAKEHRRLTIRDENSIDQSVLWWNSEHLDQPEGTIDLAYQIAPVFRDGTHELQITLIDWQQVAPPEDAVPEPPELIDCRDSFNLNRIRAEEASLMIWAEGFSQKDSPGIPLSELEEADALILYTAPPHSDALQKAIKAVRPKRLYVYAQTPPFDQAQKLIEATAALLRAAQEQYDGR